MTISENDSIVELDMVEEAGAKPKKGNKQTANYSNKSKGKGLKSLNAKISRRMVG